MSTTHLWVDRYKPKANDIIVDVGAGIGDDAGEFAAMVSPGGAVYAIEAHPVTFAKMALHNVWPNVFCINCAVSNFPRAMWIADTDDWQEAAEVGPGQGHFVWAVTLDHLTAHLSSIDLLKINIEGGEVAALQGAVQTLAKTKHLVVATHDFRADRGEGEWFRTHDSCCQMLRNAGFVLETIPGWWHVHGHRTH